MADGGSTRVLGAVCSFVWIFPKGMTEPARFSLGLMLKVLLCTIPAELASYSDMPVVHKPNSVPVLLSTHCHSHYQSITVTGHGGAALSNVTPTESVSGGGGMVPEFLEGSSLSTQDVVYHFLRCLLRLLFPCTAP